MYNNPILELQNKLNGNSPQLNPQWMQQVKNMMHQVQAAANPQFALNQMLMSNPQLAQAFSLIRSMGGNPQNTFYNYAKQMGINPEEVLNSLK